MEQQQNERKVAWLQNTKVEILIFQRMQTHAEAEQICCVRTFHIGQTACDMLHHHHHIHTASIQTRNK